MRSVRLNFAQDTLLITKAPQNRSSAITNLQLADDSDALAVESFTRYKIEFSAKKTKLMTNSTSGIQWEIKVKGSSQHKVGGEWFEIKLGKISRMLVKYEVLPIPNVIFVC